MSEKLKSCPFCGGEDVKIFGPYGWYRQFGISHSCKSFYSGTSDFFQGFSTESAAADAWNRRHQEQETSSEFERLLAK